MEQCEISIVIVSYNVENYLVKCIDSIYKNNVGLYEIIVVDNASEDNSVKIIKEKYPEINLILNRINIGFPKANNQGFKVAKGNYIFMLNPDTEITNNAIGNLKSYLDNNKEIYIIGPKLLNTDLTLQYSVWRFPKIRYIFAEMFYLSKFTGKKYYSDRNLLTPFEVDSISGAAIFFRKELLNLIGMLDEKLFWIEDVDFCYRAMEKGFKIMYNPEIVIIHHSGKSAKTNYKISISNQIFNKIKFYHKHHSSLKTFIVTIISLINVMMRLFIFTLLSPLNKIFMQKAKAYLFTLLRIFTPPKNI